MADERRVVQSRSRGERLRHVGRAARIVHPAPSLIVAAAVAVLAVVGGASTAEAGRLAIAMLGLQFSIGAINDMADADIDALGTTDKPIPGGVVSTRSAAVIATLAAAVGVTFSATFGPAAMVLGIAGWGCGVAYDLLLRRAGLGWLAFAAALPLLLAWTWAATMSFPVGWPALLLVAAVAGPMVHLANSLVDLETDERTGRRTLATALGPRRSRVTLSLLAVLVLILAVLTSATHGAIAAAQGAAFVLGATLVTTGVGLAWASSRGKREAGWLLLAIGLIPLVAAWVTN